MNKCPNCGVETDGAFCPECGTPTEVMVEQLGEVFEETVHDDRFVPPQFEQPPVEFVQPPQTPPEGFNPPERPKVNNDPPKPPVAPPLPPRAPEPAEITKRDLPDEFKPLSAWAYFGLLLLFCIPAIGLISIILLSFAPKNRNLKSFARGSLGPRILIYAVVIGVAAFLYFSGYLDKIIRAVDNLVEIINKL